jgi:cytochrome c peroxidase
MIRIIFLALLVLLSLSLLSYRLHQSSYEVIGSDGVNAPKLPKKHFNYANIELPAHLAAQVVQSMDNTPEDNPITDAGATLGRVLFYDKKLSRNDQTACASCHQQAHGFSDPKALSVGFKGGETPRHSMSVANTRFYQNGRFFWDERAESLEAQTLQPIQDPVEMGMKLKKLVKKLEKTAYYPPLFEDAFGRPEVSSDRISRALAQFMRSMVSYRSPYDEGRAITPGSAADPFSNFSEIENDGKALFFNAQKTGCSICHITDLFVGIEARNNGLYLESTDIGVEKITESPMDKGSFKIPSLRNIALTAPYMHDGSIASLEEVIEHYNSGVQDHENLHPMLRDEGKFGVGSGPPKRLNLSPYEKKALVAFLKTLSDSALTQDERWSDPFEKKD